MSENVIDIIEQAHSGRGGGFIWGIPIERGIMQQAELLRVHFLSPAAR